MASDMKSKPVIIGIYGVQGCGKTTLLNTLKDEVLGTEEFKYYDGSAKIAEVTLGKSYSSGFPVKCGLTRVSKRRV
jgi:ATPase subunit of ABC transporter with duplicated ATPase domains